jgi:RNA polymerase sigma-70 factor (ECF subfamily)
MTKINIDKKESNEEDLTLIELIKKGDEAAARKLIMKHKDKVKNLIFITIGNSIESDDISQEVFISAFKYLNNFRGDSAFSTWLYRIAINKCKDYVRKNRFRNKIELNKQNIPYSRNSDENDFGSKREILRRIINKLPETLKIPLILRDVEGLSYKEIAELLNMELSAVKSRIFRARETLKILIEPYLKEIR